MPCLLFLLALFLPRLVIVLLFLFTHYMEHAYKTLIWPILGFIFFPFTTLAYALAINANGSVGGVYLFIVVIAVIFDLGSLGIGPGTWKRRRR